MGCDIFFGRWVRREPTKRTGSPFLHVAIRDMKTGEVVSISTKTASKDTARKVAAEHIENVLHAKAIGATIPGIRFGPALREFLELKTATARAPYAEALRIDVEFYIRSLGGEDRPIGEIELKDIEDFLKTLAALQRATRTRRKHLTALRGFFTWAKRRRYVGSDPTEGIKIARKAPSGPVGRAFSYQDAARILDGAGKLRLAMLLGLQAGFRRATIQKLEWSMIDLPGRRFNLPGEALKAGRPATLPIHPELLAALQAAPRRGEKVILYSTTNDALDTAINAAGVGHWGWHDLRRTFATWAALRVPHAVLKALLCHSAEDTTGLYPKISFEDLQRAVEGLPWIVASACS